MRAIILAGGKGTRLRPYTTVIPKPLLPIGDEMPVLEIIIRQLVKQQFTHITLAVNHMANLIMAFFGDGSKWNVKIDYSMEDKPLNTLGPLTLIPDLTDDFLVMNGDLLCNIDYNHLLNYHIQKKNNITVSAYSEEYQIKSGVLKYDSDNMLTDFVEKPMYSSDVMMGIYCLNRTVIQGLPKGKPYGFDNLMLDSLKNKINVEIKPFDGYWLDIGRPNDYDTANEQYDKLKDIMGLD